MTYRRTTQNQANDSLPSDVNVLKSTKNVDLLVCENHSCPTGILNSKLGLPILARNSANRATDMFTIQRALDILQLE